MLLLPIESCHFLSDSSGRPASFHILSELGGLLITVSECLCNDINLSQLSHRPGKSMRLRIHLSCSHLYPAPRMVPETPRPDPSKCQKNRQKEVGPLTNHCLFPAGCPFLWDHPRGPPGWTSDHCQWDCLRQWYQVPGALVSFQPYP